MTNEMRMKAAVEAYLNAKPTEKHYTNIASGHGVDRNHLQRRVHQMMLIRSLDNK